MKRLCIAILGLLIVQSTAAHAVTLYRLEFNATYVASPTPDVGCRGFHITSTGTTSGAAVNDSSSIWLDGTWKDSECADVIANPGRFTVRDGMFTITAATGTLEGTYKGDGTPPDVNFNVHVQGTFEISSGAGQFAGAAGRGIFDATPNLITGNTQATFQGVLSI
ncbi:MAG: hypothetical protein ACYDCC_08970 [Actinomycetota bacterium]